MGLPETGDIGLVDIATEFGGDLPHELSEYSGKDGASGTSIIEFRGKSSGADFIGLPVHPHAPDAAHWGHVLDSSANHLIVTSRKDGNNFQGYVFILDKVTHEVQHVLTNPNINPTNADDYFGYAVAANDTHVAVAAVYEENSSYRDSGVVYVYELSTGHLVRTIQNPDAVPYRDNDQFGVSLDLNNNNILAVGSENESGPSPTYESSEGRAYLFNALTGAVLASIPAPQGSPGLVRHRWFGASVALTDTHLFVGARGSQTDAGNGAGYVYKFALNGALVDTIVNPADPATNSNFGTNVRVQNGYLAVSSNLGTGGEMFAGAVHVFSASTCQPIYTVTNPNVYGTPDFDHFSRISVSDKYLVVCAQNEDTETSFNVGIAYVFDITNGNPITTIPNPEDTSGGFGHVPAVIIGDDIYVSAYYQGTGKIYKVTITPPE